MQLAKLTPSEVIETAYLSSLLEQQPHTNIASRTGFSRRFETLRTFLKEVVCVVPIESSVHAIAVANEIPVALKFCEQLKVSNISLVPSIILQESLVSAIERLCNRSVKHLSFTSEASGLKKRTEDPRVLYLQQTLDKLALKEQHGTSVLCGINLEDAYPISDEIAEHPFKSPLQILIKGREDMQRLVKDSSQIVNRELNESSTLSISQHYNSEMLKNVNQIRKNVLAPCTLLLGSFMEKQIRVPLKKTDFDSAKAIQIATSAAALGVWALISLDVKAFINTSQSLVVEITQYIKGFFKQEISVADENYAGKLQFMVQGISETVGCNRNYISYSLERQLLELCKNRNIDISTPLDELINEWDKIFKDNTMSLVSPPFRGLISRWLKWALMIHRLREELASSSAIGVVGLVNSGKSLLVSTLFDIKVLILPTNIITWYNYINVIFLDSCGHNSCQAYYSAFLVQHGWSSGWFGCD